MEKSSMTVSFWYSLSNGNFYQFCQLLGLPVLTISSKSYDCQYMAEMTRTVYGFIWQNFQELEVALYGKTGKFCICKVYTDITDSRIHMGIISSCT
jgi:hypothetical protein